MNENVVSLPAEAGIGGIGPPREDMTQEQQQAWNDVVSSSPGTFIRSDRLILELVAVTLARYRVSPNRQTRRVLGRLFRECLISAEVGDQLMTRQT